MYSTIMNYRSFVVVVIYRKYMMLASSINIYNGRIGEYKIGVHQSAAIKLLVRALWALKHLCCNDVKPKLILALGFVAFEVNASSF